MKENRPYSEEYANDVVMRKYFSSLALRHLNLVKMHGESGHLPSFKNLTPEQIAVNIESGGQKDWSNVIRHCLAEAGAADALSHLLDLSAEDKENLIQAAILHDFDKKLEIENIRGQSGKITEASEKFKLVSKETLRKNGIKSEIIDIIDSVGDVDIVHKENVSLLQKAMFYIDNITEGSNLVNVKIKRDGLLKRYAKLAEESEFLDKWVSSTEEIQKELAEKIGLSNSEELPSFILQKVKELARKASV
jgi:predicted hydrolase (HD superfamily)